MTEKNVEALLDAEVAASMRKRPGMYIGGSDYRGIQELFAVIFKSILRNSTSSLRVEWVIEDNENCTLTIVGGELEGLKKLLGRFIQVDSIVPGIDYAEYFYYMIFLFFFRLEVLFVYDHEQLYIVKEQGNLGYQYEASIDKNQCTMKITLDNKVFGPRTFLFESLSEYVKNYAYQYPNLMIILKDNRELKQLSTYCYPNGLEDKLNYFKYINHGGTSPLWEVQHECSVDGCEIKLLFYIFEHIYLHPPCEAVYADDYLVLDQDRTLKGAVIEAMKQSMEQFSDQNNLQLLFREKQLYYLTDFVASIHGDKLRYGTWKNKLEMNELRENLRKHMKQYFDELFLSDKKYVGIMEKIGFKVGNSLFLDAVFPANE